MNRVQIIGCCGAGKSTFARALRARTNLPIIHLDQHYWKPDWVETDEAEWIPKVHQLAAQPSWIIDGNYGGTLDIRIAKADTIIYLDYATPKCLWRVLKRIYKYRGTERPDMSKGCKERFDWEFIHYVAMFNFSQRKSLHQKLEAVKDEKEVFIFRKDREVAQFLEKL